MVKVFGIPWSALDPREIEAMMAPHVMTGATLPSARPLPPGTAAEARLDYEIAAARGRMNAKITALSGPPRGATRRPRGGAS